MSSFTPIPKIVLHVEYFGQMHSSLRIHAEWVVHEGSHAQVQFILEAVCTLHTHGGTAHGSTVEGGMNPSILGHYEASFERDFVRVTWESLDVFLIASEETVFDFVYCDSNVTYFVWNDWEFEEYQQVKWMIAFPVGYNCIEYHWVLEVDEEWFLFVNW